MISNSVSGSVSGGLKNLGLAIRSCRNISSYSQLFTTSSNRNPSCGVTLDFYLDMTKGKTKGSTKQQAKGLAQKSKSEGNSRKQNKAPTKKTTNSRKRPASESDGPTSSDEEPEEPHPHKKTKYISHTAGEEVDEQPEEVEDEDEEPEVEAGEKETSDLEGRHYGEIPEALIVKNNTTKDLLTIFSDRITVNFKEGDRVNALKGRWCLPCRANKEVTKGSERNAFFTGGNSTCRSHIRQHYQLYRDRCKVAGIPENHHAIPRPLWKQMQEGKKQLVVKRQAKIDVMLEIQPRPNSKQFTRDGALEAIAQFVACHDQDFAVVEKPVFRNCLIAMRPRTTHKDLPSTHNVVVHIHNEFVTWLKKLKGEILEAPGKISTTADGWMGDNTKGSFLGMTAHWIEVKNNKWKLRSEVVGFQPVSGEHSGWNLGRYFVGLCDRVGIFNKDGSKLFTVTLDNASNNFTTCDTIETFSIRRLYKLWKAEENQLPCFGHDVNIANVAVMTHITKIAAIETMTAIWEYDPSLPDNRVLGGLLDVIAAIRTTAIKIQASGQRIEYFEKLQLQCKIPEPLRIPLHSNVRWGSAYHMLDRSYKLRQAINLFLQSADALYGPITTIRRNGRIEKKIRWSAFIFTDRDWERVKDARDILKDSNNIQEHFSSERLPMLWRALPALEELQTAWEAKRDSDKYSLYKDAINDGLGKLQKYYSCIDSKPVFILALVLHPYYKLDYIALTWGGEAEQAKERAAGNRNAKNWQDEARKVVEKTMETYYRQRPRANTPNSPTPSQEGTKALSSEFDRYRQTLIEIDNEGWASELRQYLKDRPADVTKDTDIIGWWQDHAALYPTLARIALDVLPCQASSVPCERLFSASKKTADVRRASLGAKRFEELQIMKFAWQQNIIDLAAWNSAQLEEVELDEYSELLEAEELAAEWDNNVDIDAFILDN